MSMNEQRSSYVSSFCPFYSFLGGVDNEAEKDSKEVRKSIHVVEGSESINAW